MAQTFGGSVDEKLKQHFKPENVDAVRSIIQNMYANADTGDKATMGAQLIPGVGDVAGLANDARHWVDDHEAGKSWTPEDYTLAAAGLLPVVPSLSMLRGASRAASGAGRVVARAVPEVIDDAKKFGSPLAAGGLVYGGATGATILGQKAGQMLHGSPDSYYSPNHRPRR